MRSWICRRPFLFLGLVLATCVALQACEEGGTNPTAPSSNPAPSPPPTVAQFDGAYRGSYSGQFAGEADSGAVEFSVSNGVITVAKPASGSGLVVTSGSANFSGTLAAEGVSCSYTGLF